MSYVISSGEISNDFIVSGYDSMTVLDGGTANNTTLINDGYLNVSSGGTANSTTLNVRGFMRIFSGGIANRATVNSGGVLNVDANGTTNNAIVNVDGMIWVSNGGVVNTTILNRGLLEISSGTVNNTLVNAGRIRVSYGGVANDTIINSGGILCVSRGGTANSTIVNSGGSAVVSSGTVNSTTVNSGGRLVISYGTANNVLENGGFVSIYNAADITFKQNTFSGLVLNKTSATVHSGTTANSTTVNNGGQMYVYSGGIANTNYIRFSGALILSGGSANSTLISSGGILTISSGGKAYDTIVNSGGSMLVSNGGTATIIFNPWQGSIVSSNGAVITYLERDVDIYYGNGDRGIVSKANAIDNLEIESGLSVIVYAQGTANEITVNSGGCFFISSGGTVNGIITTSGAYISFDVASNTYVNGTYDGSAFEMKDALISGYTVNSNRLCVHSGGTANDTNVCSGGVLNLSGGTANNTTINGKSGFNNSGLLFVYYGGIANNTTVNSGGLLSMWYHGVTNDTTVNSGGSMIVYYECTANNTTVNSGGILSVSYGGMTSDTIVHSNGSMFVSSGGTASETVFLGGKLVVSDGGTATITFCPWQKGSIVSGSGATVTYLERDVDIYYGNGDRGIVSKANAIDNLEIESGLSVIVYAQGTANNTTVNASGELVISSGGTATNIVATSGARLVLSVASNTYVNGAYDGSTFEMKDAFISGYAVNSGCTLSVSSGGVATDLAVSTGGSLIIFEGGEANTATVSSGGTVFVSSGGEADNLVFSSGGIGYLYDMGTANSAVINSSGCLHVSSRGTATNATINSGGSMHVSSGGIAEKTDIASFGQLFIYSNGTANSTTVNWGGNLFLSSGGTANQTTIEGGRLTVSNGGYASGMTLRAGTDRTYGDLYIYAGGVVEDAVIEQYGDCYISSGGTVNNITVNPTGYMRIEVNATAAEIKENGGYVEVKDGATATFASNTFSGVELNNASATVHSGTTANSTTVNSSSYLYVYDGGSADSTMVNSDSYLFVCEGATANETAVNSAGSLYISSGGTASKTMVKSGGSLYVSSGATATELTAETGAYLALCVTADTLITGTSGGEAFEIRNGAVTDDYILGPGRLELGTGVNANGITVNSGGCLYLSSGATATNITENGGFVYIEEDTEVSFVKNSFCDLVLSDTSATIHSGTTANNIFVSSGGGIRIYSDGIVDSVDVNKGGILYISSGGTATTIRENGGYVSAADGAIVSFESVDLKKLTLLDSASIHANTRMTSTTVSRGGLYVSNGGIADTTILLGGRSYIFSGGLANRTTMYSNARFEVKSGGTASGIVIKSRGSATVSEGGVLCDLNISSGGTLYLRGGRISGRIAIESGAYVSVDNDRTTLNFDISGVIPDATVRVNDLSWFGNSVQYTLTVGTQKSGSYALAEGALQFNSTITVYNSDGVQLGTLTAGNTLTTEKATYTLVSFGESLSVDVETVAPKTPTVSADITTPTAQPVTVTAVFSDDIAVREYSYDEKEWIAYTGPIEVSENGIVYFRGADAAGNMSEILAFTVDNIDTMKPTISNIKASTQAPTGENVTITAVFADDVKLASALYKLGENGVWVAYPIGGVTVTNNCTVYFKAVDTASNETEANIEITNIDRTAPEITLNGDTTTPLQSTTLTATVDDGSPISYRIGEDGEWKAYTEVITVTANATYYFKATDKADNTGTASITFTNIDNVKPVITLTGDITTPLQSTTLTATVDDGSAIYYRIGEEVEWTEYTDAITVSANATYYFKATDAADNTGTASITFTNIDTKPPVITLTGDITTPLQSTTLTASVDDGSAIYYRIGDEVEWTEYTDVLTVNDNVTYYFKATDKAENTGTASITFTNIDRIPPAKPTVVADITELTKNDVTLTAEFSNDSVKKEYSLDGGQTWESYEVGGVIIIINQTAMFRATDAAGNTSETTYEVTNIDKNAPVITLTGDAENSLLSSTLTAEVDDGSTLYYRTRNTDEWMEYTEAITVTANGTYFFKATDALGNTGTAEYVFTNILPVLTSDVAPQTQTWETTENATQYIVEYSTDNFEHVIRLEVDSNSLDFFQMPAGTYQMRVKPEGSEDWTQIEEFESEEESDMPKVVLSIEDGNDDLFFATPNETWGNLYFARHVGSINDWSGTNDLVSAGGKGRIQNLFFGSADPNVLCLTDADNGDAIFVDDIYTDLPNEVEKNTARLYKIQEVRAGAGDDIVDMTSQRFEYVGDGLTIRGGDGDDVIWANKGDNMLFGDAGDDRIVGASGNDVIVGGIGDDRMHGGGGNDIFTFCDNWGKDTVVQSEGGSVTLWFAAELEGKVAWDEVSKSYTDGTNHVKVEGFDVDQVTLKFGSGTTPEDAARFAELSDLGAFDNFTSQKIFEESKGILS